MANEQKKPDMSHLPLCDCANTSAYCLFKGSRQPGRACMANDDWFSVPAARKQDDWPPFSPPWEEE